MTTLSEAQEISPPVVRSPARSALVRVMQYSGVRLITLFGTIVVAVYLTIMIANMGGYVDNIMRSEIRERITVQVAMNPANRNLDPDVRNKLTLDRIALEEKRLGLNQPLAVRSLLFLTNALTLHLGRAVNMASEDRKSTRL